MNYRRPKGTFDILPEDAPHWCAVESAFRDTCARYGYGEIRTPIFEDTDLFTRSVGEETDIVSKEMYTFEDKGGRSQTLRAEGTAPTVRAFIEGNMQGQDQEKLVRLFYLAPIFRYDRPQAGRYRQHHQAGIEALGSMDPAVDAEIIDLALSFYCGLGIAGTRLLVNSVGCPACAPAYVDKLKATIADRVEDLCGDCRRRFDTNPLRVLDCKKEACRAITGDAPTMLDALCDECDDHFAGFCAALDTLGHEYEIDSRIVRGLDYYTKTAFELRHDALGAQDSIGGGGRYDGLVEQCGGRATPGVGLGMGIERVLLVREALGIEDATPEREGIFVVLLGDTAWALGYRLLHDLRAAGLHTDIDYRHRSMRAQLRHADREGFARAVIIGEDELVRGVATVRDMESGEQAEIALDDLPARLQPL